MGLNLGTIQKKQGEYIFWDLGGQKVLRKIWSKYYQEAQCVTFVIDGSDTHRFSEAIGVLRDLYASDEGLQQKPLLILLNKVDSETFDSDGLELKLEGLDAKVVKVLKVSALSKQGLHECLEWLTNL